MDCKTENAVRTYIRIEVIVLQGLLQGLFLSLMGFVLIPFVPFFVAFVRWKVTKGSKRWFTRVVCLPMWFLSGFLFGVINPIGILLKTFTDIKEITRVEWQNRWMTGKPKKPNGHPLPIRSPDEQERLDAAITMGVVRDYNEEAIAHGQGIDLEDEDE